MGAADFIPKTETVLLQECIQHQLNLQQVEKKEDSSNIDSAIVGESKVMMALREKINQFSNTVFPILIEGESGTGKELIAKTLHQQSLRNEKPFLVMNCAAVEAKNFESILFGKSRGAFSGSLSNTNGLFNSAEEGVLFFENIDEMPVDIQVKIVRVIDDAEYYQFGDNKTKKLKTKIIAAS
ncbi:MAG: sigma 54-interacting transcriptional regulator, partial [Gammaproteobacteria bacterium]|nr:sigma 54-interacting transcriptional regulator [Gammaproteobacteria bacterium]